MKGENIYDITFNSFENISERYNQFLENFLLITEKIMLIK